MLELPTYTRIRRRIYITSVLVAKGNSFAGFTLQSALITEYEYRQSDIITGSMSFLVNSRDTFR